MLKKHSVLLDDIIMNAKCYIGIFKGFIKIWLRDNRVIYGNENGNLFLFLKIISDVSVFVYEALNFKKLNPLKNIIQIMYGQEYLKNLELIRNNIHLYNKYGSYKNKADHIIDNELNEFKMKNHDFLYQLRNDIALIYKITSNKKIFLGTNYFYYHYVYEANGLNWSENQIEKYASNTSSIISFIANGIYSINVPEINYKNDDIHIEFFDYKSENLFKNVNVSYTTAFRLILILAELSYMSILIDDILQIQDFHKINTLWMLFLSKYIAAKYDESLDSMENMIKYSKDKNLLKKIISNNFKETNVNIREFGRNLRNMIHFGLKNVNRKKYNSNLSLVKLYLLETNTDDLENFIDNCILMRNDMKNLENNIRGIFNLDKS